MKWKCFLFGLYAVLCCSHIVMAQCYTSPWPEGTAMYPDNYDTGDGGKTYGGPDANVKKIELANVNTENYGHTLTVLPNQDYDVKMRITNKGDEDIDYFEAYVYRSTDQNFDPGGDTSCGREEEENDLDDGQGTTKYRRCSAPGAEGIYPIYAYISRVDGEHGGTDQDWDNNTSREDDTEEYGKLIVQDTIPTTLTHGEIISLKSLGELSGNRYLDGMTHLGIAGLTQSPGLPFTGTLWQVHDMGSGLYAFKTLGHIEGNRWLDGRTHEGTVGLAPSAGGAYSGTLWQVYRNSAGNLRFKCMGALEGPRWLDGVTHMSSVRLVESTDYSGTKWEKIPLTFSWSFGGPLAGLFNVQWFEGADPHTWADNYLASNINLNMQWSPSGPIGGLRCTQIYEGADPHTWLDNYFCVPNECPINFFWSSSGPIGGKKCLKVNEPADPHTWDDNYLCW